MQMQSTAYGSAYTRREKRPRCKDSGVRERSVGGAAEGAKSKRKGERRRRRGKKRDPHSRRLSCSPSAYHGVRGQDLYVEFIVAESALLRFMDVFRRSAAARVIYRGTLALPPSPSHSVTELFSPPLSLSPSPALIRCTGVVLRETEGFLMNATTESLFSSLSLASPPSLFLFHLSRRLSLSLSLFHFLPRCFHTLLLSDSFL